MNHAPLAMLYLNVLVVASCGLIYELLAGTLASYVLGDSVTQFSLVIGVYLFALGVGAWLSKFVTRQLARVFVEVELAVALLGGCSAPVLLLAFGYVRSFHLTLFGLVLAIGTLVGLELPLLMRILKEHVDFSDLVSRVLAFDYIGALAASLLFPIVLVPYLGLVRTSLAFGILNALVGLWGTYLLAPLLPGRVGGLQGRAVLVIGLLVVGLIKADWLTDLADERQLEQTIVLTTTTPYQRIVVTQSGEDRAGHERDFQLLLNGNLQFHSADEYRYHEALVHPPLLCAAQPRRVLVLGGGDGLAVREILKHPSVKHVTLVDIDPAMTDLAGTFPLFTRLNENALADPRVRVVNDDAFLWIEQPGEPFDAAVIDFPDPSTFSVGKLYTTRFYRLLKQRLAATAAISIQCTSPLSAPRSYWCIVRTLEESGFSVRPYHAAVPAFGVWGFVLATQLPSDPPAELPGFLDGRLRFLTAATLRGLFELPADIARRDVEVNKLNNQILVRYYEDEWSRWR